MVMQVFFQSINDSFSLWTNLREVKTINLFNPHIRFEAIEEDL